MQQLDFALNSVPRGLGYATDVWNAPLLHAEILRRLGVTLSELHSRRLFKILQQLHPQKID